MAKKIQTVQQAVQSVFSLTLNQFDVLLSKAQSIAAYLTGGRISDVGNASTALWQSIDAGNFKDASTRAIAFAANAATMTRLGLRVGNLTDCFKNQGIVNLIAILNADNAPDADRQFAGSVIAALEVYSGKKMAEAPAREHKARRESGKSLTESEVLARLAQL